MNEKPWRTRENLRSEIKRACVVHRTSSLIDPHSLIVSFWTTLRMESGDVHWRGQIDCIFPVGNVLVLVP